MARFLTVADLVENSVLTDDKERQCKNSACIVTLLKKEPIMYKMPVYDGSFCILCVLNEITTFLHNKEFICIPVIPSQEGERENDVIALEYINKYALSIGDVVNSFSKNDMIKSVTINDNYVYHYISMIEFISHLSLVPTDSGWKIVGYENVMYTNIKVDDHISEMDNIPTHIYSPPSTIGRIRYLSATLESLNYTVITTGILVQDNIVATIVKNLTIIKCVNCTSGRSTMQCNTVCRYVTEAIKILHDISTIVTNSTLPKDARDDIASNIKTALCYLHDKLTLSVFDLYIKTIHAMIRLLKSKVSPNIDDIPFTTITQFVSNKDAHLRKSVLHVLGVDNIDSIPCDNSIRYGCSNEMCECNYRYGQASYVYNQYKYIFGYIKAGTVSATAEVCTMLSTIIYTTDILLVTANRVHDNVTEHKNDTVIIPPHGEISTCLFIDMYNMQKNAGNLNIQTMLTVFQNKISTRQIARYNNNTIPILPAGVMSLMGYMFMVLLLGTTTALYNKHENIISLHDRILLLAFSRFSIYNIVLQIDDKFFSSDRHSGLLQTIYTILVLGICKSSPDNLLVMITNNYNIYIDDAVYNRYMGLLTICRTLVTEYILAYIIKKTPTDKCIHTAQLLRETLISTKDVLKRPIIYRNTIERMNMQPVIGSSKIASNTVTQARELERASYKIVQKVLILMATTHVNSTNNAATTDILDLAILNIGSKSLSTIASAYNYKTCGYDLHTVQTKVKKDKNLFTLYCRILGMYSAPQYFFMPSQYKNDLLCDNMSLYNNSIEICDLCYRISFTYDIYRRNTRNVATDTSDIITIDISRFITHDEITGKCTSCQSKTSTVPLNGFAVRSFSSFTGNRTRNTVSNGISAKKFMLSSNCKIVANRSVHSYTPYIITMCAKCDACIRVVKENLIGDVYMDEGCIEQHVSNYMSMHPESCINPTCNLTKNKRFIPLPTYQHGRGCYWTHVCNICVSRIYRQDWVFRTESEWVAWIATYKINLSQIDYNKTGNKNI